MKTFRKNLSLLLALIMCLSTVSIAATAAEIKYDGAWTYMVEGGTATIYFCDNTITGDVTIPSTLGGYKVTAIAEKAFNNRDSFNSVTIPDSVITIGNEAFKASALTSIKFGKGLKTIAANAFAFCTGLTSLSIPDNVTTIGEYAFYNCTSLAKVTIGKGVTTIPNNAFNTCTNLEDLTIGNNVTTIGNSAFINCYSLTSIAMPDSLTTIDSSAFRSCNSLIAITFGKNIKSIGYGAFTGCAKLTDVYFKGKTSEWNSVTIGYSNAPLTNANIHILGDPIIPVNPGNPGTPSNPDTPDNPGSADDDNNQVACDCKCHSKGLKKFLFKIMLFFQKIFRKNQSCACGALHYVIL